jgi:hypothetical protein
MAGTRGGLGRIVAMVIGLVALAFLLLAGTARARGYEVAQCGWGVGAELDPAAPRTEGDAAYLHPGWCTAPPAGTPAGMAFELGLAPYSDQGIAQARWVAPPGTNFAGARFTWSGELQDGTEQIAGVDDGGEFHILASAFLSNAPGVVSVGVTGPAPAFEVRLKCLVLGAWPVGCTRSARSALRLSGLILTVDDPTPPAAKLAGALPAAGWHRGTVPLEVSAEDPVGGGVAREEVAVDGAPLAGAPVACTVATIEGVVRGTRLRPCPPTAAGSFEVDTTKLADGEHSLRGCAVDFGGGQGCAGEARIEVDNSPPQVDFAAAPEGQMAARVSDAFSGAAAGTISVRRADSESWSDLPTTFDRGTAGSATLRAPLPDLSAGAYVFRATATDAAGNSGSAQLRAAGSVAELRQQAAAGGSGSGRRGAHAPGGRGHSPKPRRRVTHLVARLVEAGGRASRSTDRALADLADRGSRPRSAGSPLTVDYGSAVEARGRLTDAHGAGIADRPVIVVARAAPGTGNPPERRRVVTDRSGRFALRLPPGTSRRVVVAFHGGGGFAPARRPLALRVRAAVTLAAAPLSLRTGESVALSGRVTLGAARIPKRGKVVTIQYLERASGHWRPALVVRTDPRGRFAVHYRFRYVVGEARIRLRATALPEAGWPYAEGSSPPVVVRVRG